MYQYVYFNKLLQNLSFDKTKIKNKQGKKAPICSLLDNKKKKRKYGETNKEHKKNI